MNVAVTSTRRWNISARLHGEVLTAGARGPGCEFTLLGVPQGYTPTEVEGWLQDLIGVARETSREDERPRPIPTLLHHALTGLLFSHSEVWNRAGGVSCCSLAFVNSGSEVGFGWIGPAEPEVTINGRRTDIEWVRVRDEAGSEARAFGVDAMHRVDLAFTWVAHPEDPGSPRIELLAQWPGEGAAERPAPPAIPAAAPGPAEAPGSMVDAPRPEVRRIEPAVASYDTSGRRLEAGARAPSHRHEEAAAAEPVAPGTAESFTAHVEDLELAPTDPWVAAEDVPPDSIVPPERRRSIFRGWLEHVWPWAQRPEPFPPSDDLAAAESQAGAHVIEPMAAAGPHAAGASMPDVIPPSPEPRELTERAAEWRSPHVAPPHVVPPAHRAPPPSRGTEASIPLHAGSLETPMPPADDPAAFGLPPGPASRVRRAPLRPDWPVAEPAESRRPIWKRTWAWVALVLALFAGGWLVGGLQDQGDRAASPRNPLARALRSVGLGGARFHVTVNSRPPGAWIAADGKDLARRTPASVELAPGVHQITLSFSDLGSATFEVRGERGERQVLDAPLWGSIAIHSADAALPIAVTVDGASVGFAPVSMDSLLPGAHELRFSGPGMTSWGQTVRVRVGEPTEVLARPMTSPATGVIEVRASFTDEGGTQVLTGANVWVDGEKKGATPVTLELPRGPHSIRVEYHGEQAPIQVIDLPGGNQRFATFELGLNLDRPSLRVVAAPARMPLDQPTVISASLEEVAAAEVREMWLHVRAPDGPWRRYQMVMLKAPSGIVGVALFPTAMFDEHGASRYYVSASIQSGDEFFTEIQGAQLSAPASAR